VYSVRPDTSGDIRKAFYGTRYNRVSTHYSTAYNFTGFSGSKKMELAQNKRSYQLADFKSESQYAEAKIRKEFKDTAFWKPDVVTGADGKATVKFNLPDNLTTWRATARAVSADLRVGSNVARVVSRKDLILRLETPRFMTEGDTVTVSGIVHNYLDAEKVTQIELKVAGANLLDTPQQTVTIAKQGEHRIDWRISAQQLGNVTLLATAKTNAESDGIELPVPVVPQGLKQTKGSAAAISDEVAEKTFILDLPGNANTQARTLRIEAAPSIAGAMFGALDYLTSYPYGCTEQTMSSFLPNVIVAQALKDVKSASIKGSNDLGKKVQSGLERLYKLQHGDGGWGWWLNDKTDPFMTAYVVDGLAMARRAGYGVNSYALDQGRDRVKQLLDSGKLEDGKPIDPESRAYLIYALNVSGEADARYINDLFAKRVDLQPYGRALLALALKHRGDGSRAKQVAGEIERNARVTDFDAHWESRRRPMLDFNENNDLEATALSLKALAQTSPQSALLPKAARWLVGNRRHGYYWDSTKHTAFAILALTDYLKVSRELSADYSVEVFLNGEPVLSKRITSADAAAGQPIVVERKGNAITGANQVRVVKRGAGVLYASATLDYYTREENFASQSSNELKLERDYLRLRVVEEGGKPVWKLESLSGELRSGDLIVARLRAQGARAQYLMIEDPIPAGCEQLERVSGINLDYSDNRWSERYSNREFRDQRTVIFADYFDGDATYQYALRVQIPGEFKVAPARAELMYQPTVQANTENRKLSILDKR
ncbi:MAG: alpha-2-macroglobulin family protein, partial [Blastocatellia bacterium]